MHMSENPTPTDASSLSKTQLLQKQQEGTLTNEEMIQFLIKVRGMLRSDAEYVIYARYKQEVQIRERSGPEQGTPSGESAGVTA